MSVHTVVTCNGYWDDGRMPCRGSITVSRGVSAPAVRSAAARAGWSWGAPLGDLCPAHTRIERERTS